MPHDRIRCTLTRARGVTAGLLLALVAAGCTSVAPERVPTRIAAPAAFRHADARADAASHAEDPSRTPPSAPAWAAAPADGAWWRAFDDPVLDDLVARATQANPVIHEAIARLAQARAVARGAEASSLPQVALATNASHVNGPLVNAAGGEGTLISVGAGLSYEADLFGRIAALRDAATLDVEARDALLRVTRLLVQAETVQSYLAWRALDDERALVQGAVDAYRETVALTERRWRAGHASELDLARVRAEQVAHEADLLTIERRGTELEHALALLAATPVARFERLSPGRPPRLPDIPPGIPSTVLERRPDVAAAWHALAAAQARIGAAQAARLPSLTLTGSGGFAASGLADLFRMSMRAWGLGVLAALPLYDGGRRQAVTDQAVAEFDAVAARYQQQVLVALKEVEDQLAALRVLGRQARVQQGAVGLAARAAQLSESRHRNGLASQLELLDARRTELRNRRLALQIESSRQQATVGLIRALGGGWGDAPVRGGITAASVAAAGR